MKGAAKCDKHCDLQNSVNLQESERMLRSRDIPESMPASVSTPFHSSGKAGPRACLRLRGFRLRGGLRLRRTESTTLTSQHARACSLATRAH